MTEISVSNSLSDGKISLLFNAIANQKDTEDEEDDEFDKVAHVPVNEASKESGPPEKDIAAANLPNFQAMTVAQVKDELKK